MVKTFMFIVGGAVMAQAGITASLPTTEVFDDIRSSCICVVGSLAGAFIAIAIFPPSGMDPANAIRRLSLKFGASMAGGVVFAPAIMQHMGLPKTADNLMGCSGFVAVFSVAVLHYIAPRILGAINRAFKHTDQ